MKAGRAALAGLIGLCLAVAALVLRLPAGAPSTGAGWRGLEVWYQGAGPGGAAIAVLRLLALAASAWLGLAALVQLASSVRGGQVLPTLADRLSPAFVRSLGQGIVGASMAASLAVPSLPATQPAQDPPAGPGSGVAIMRPLPGEATAPTTTTTTTTTTASPAAPVPPPAEPATPAPPTPSPPPPGPQEIVVEPGDSCWSLAEEHLRDELGREPTEAETARLWAQLIEINEERFLTGDPDLLFPGQGLLLPER